MGAIRLKLGEHNRMRNLEVIGSRQDGGGNPCVLRRLARVGLLCATSVLLLAAARVSWAADRPPARSGSSAPATPTYRIGAGDVLSVEVVGRKDLSSLYTVGQDGVLFMPLTGGVAAEGKTANELSAELARRLSLYDRDITQVNVSVSEFRSQKIFVLGAVLKPGKYSFAQLPTVWDAITEAGGPAEDAQLSAVEVIPSDQTSGRASQTIDIASAIREGRVQNLERLKPGDTVRVPRGLPGSALGTAGSSVFMFGAIGRPGPLAIDKQIDLMGAIAQSGGATPDANLKAVRIVRRTGPRVVRMKVNLNDYIDKAKTSGNPTLMPGDTVILPRAGSGSFMSVLRIVSPILAVASTVILIVRR
jgi:polysaccharide export outer membrane protein